MSMIEADFTTLMNQSSMTAEKWLHDADEYLRGSGFDAPFQDAPELVAAFVNAASRDLGASVIAKALFEIAAKEGAVDQSYELQGIENAIENVGKSLNGISDAIENK